MRALHEATKSRIWNHRRFVENEVCRELCSRWLESAESKRRLALLGTDGGVPMSLRDSAITIGERRHVNLFPHENQAHA